jgi:long-subunit acyl-CoA synthetase (AMP-forming)
LDYLIILRYGCCAIFSCGDILKIKEDLAVIRPTLMAIVPRLITRFYGVI